MRNIKEFIVTAVDLLRRIVCGIVFLCGIVFVADQVNIGLMNRSYAENDANTMELATEPPKLPKTDEMTRVYHEKVYVDGNYYLVFHSQYGDIEVIQLY